MHNKFQYSQCISTWIELINVCKSAGGHIHWLETVPSKIAQGVASCPPLWPETEKVQSSYSNWQQELAWTKSYWQLLFPDLQDLWQASWLLPYQAFGCFWLAWCNDTCERLWNLTRRNDLHHFQSSGRANGQHFDCHVPIVPPWRQCFWSPKSWPLLDFVLWSRRAQLRAFVDRPGGVCSIASGSGPVIRKRHYHGFHQSFREICRFQWFRNDHLDSVRKFVIENAVEAIFQNYQNSNIN